MSFWRRVTSSAPVRYRCVLCEAEKFEFELCQCQIKAHFDFERRIKLREIHEKVFIASLPAACVDNSVDAGVVTASRIANTVTRDWVRLENERESFIQGLLS